jgi:putative membrane protein
VIDRSLIRRFLLVLLLLAAQPALAHEGKPHSLHELANSWAFEPGIVVPLLLSLLLYLHGTQRFWRKSGLGRGVKIWHVAAFAAGWLSLVVALVSPLHPWGRVLFSAHMTQHEILMLIAAPLLVLGRPLLVFLRALPSHWSGALVRLTHVNWWESIWHCITRPFTAWLIHAVVLWGWHAPYLFQATIDHEWVHAAQHSSFLFSALLFWWAILQGNRSLINHGAAVLYLFTTAMHSGLLGALITVAHRLLYPAYADTTQAWGLTPLEDQQLGGLIMWVPAGVVYVVASLAFFAGWLRASEERVRKKEAVIMGTV